MQKEQNLFDGGFLLHLNTGRLKFAQGLYLIYLKYIYLLIE